MIDCIPAILKWRLCHHEELESWCEVCLSSPLISPCAEISTQGNTAILGDACHPTLPYQAQGAAMAIEDGVLIRYLLGRLVHDFTTRDCSHQGAIHSEAL